MAAITRKASKCSARAGSRPVRRASGRSPAVRDGSGRSISRLRLPAEKRAFERPFCDAVPLAGSGSGISCGSAFSCGGCSGSTGSGYMPDKMFVPCYALPIFSVVGCIGFVLKRYEIGRSGKNFSCIAKALPIGKSPLPFSQFVIVSFDFSVTSARSLFVRPVRLISATKLGYAIFCVPPFTFSDASEL